MGSPGASSSPVTSPLRKPRGAEPTGAPSTSMTRRPSAPSATTRPVTGAAAPSLNFTLRPSRTLSASNWAWKGAKPPPTPSARKMGCTCPSRGGVELSLRGPGPHDFPLTHLCKGGHDGVCDLGDVKPPTEGRRKRCQRPYRPLHAELVWGRVDVYTDTQASPVCPPGNRLQLAQDAAKLGAPTKDQVVWPLDGCCT